MQLISSRLTFWNKRVFPVAWFSIIGIVLVTALVVGGPAGDPIMLAVPCIMAVVGYVMMRKLLWNLADEVYDGGDYLLVRMRGQEERLALSNVMNVNSTTYTNPTRITLRLVTPGKFGNEVAFSPARAFTLNPFARSLVAEDLMVRVDRARARRKS